MNFINPYRFVATTPPSTYLLDTYTNGLRAFSLRKLKTGATYGIRVQRTDLTETDVELYDDGSSIDLNSTVSAGGDLTTWAGSNNVNITRLYDQVDNSRYLTPSTLKARILVGGVLYTKNSNSAIYMTTGRHLEESAISGLASGNDFSVFSVTANYSSNNVGAVMTTNRTGYTTAFTQLKDNRTQKRHTTVNGTGYNLLAQDSSLNQKLLVTIVDGSAKGVETFADSVAQSTGTFSTAYNNNLFSIGDAQYTTTLGYFQELVIFDAKENTNRNAIETEINNHYSIY